MKKLVAFFSLMTLTISCSPDGPVNNSLTAIEPPAYVPPTIPPVDLTPCDTIKLKNLATAANGSDFKIGVQFSGDNLPAQTEFFNKLTAEIDRTTIYTSMYDILKFNSTTGVYSYDFTKLDGEIAYAKSKGLDIHSNVLIYPLNYPNGTPQIYVSPEFMINFPNATQADKDNFKTVIINYLKAVGTHCAGKVQSFEVFNEIFNNTGGVDRTTWLRKRFPLTDAGDFEYYDFVVDCYKAIHEADPNVKLFYNDYKQEEVPAKGNKIKEFLAYIKSKGAPIHGYGLQFHTFLTVPKSGYESALATAVETGLLIHISELDVSINVGGSLTADSNQIPSLFLEQRIKYKQVAEAYKVKVPAAQQYGITMWDSTDATTWFTQGTPPQRTFEAPTMFDGNNKRKPAYFGFAEGLSGKAFTDCGN